MCGERISWTVLTFLGDAGKGALAVWLAYQIDPSSFTMAAAGLSVLLGHIYPVSLGFRGGKGVATAFGVFLVLGWPLALGLMVVWLSILVLTRTASVASIVVAGIAPFGFDLWGGAPMGKWVGFMSRFNCLGSPGQHRPSCTREEHNI